MEKYSSYKDSGVQWLGQIPCHWDVLALKHILKFKKVLVGQNASKYDLLSLTLQGVIKRDMDNPQGKFPSSFDTYQEVNPGDFIFCNFDNEETPRAVGLSPFHGMITGAYDVLYRKNNSFSDKYLIYYFLYIDDAKRFKPLYKGLRKTVPFDSFMSYKIPVPPIKEQDAMVAYLDNTTSKIDEAIAQQQRMIDLLNERKRIMVSNVLTKGLNSKSSLKASGIDYLGEIPSHWNVLALKYIGKVEKAIIDPKELKGKMVYEYSMPAFDEGRRPQYVPAENLDSSRLLITGPTLLINKLNVHKERIWYISNPREISVASGEFVPVKIYKDDPLFIQYSLLNYRVTDYLINNSNGATNSQKRVSPDVIRSIKLPIPPLDEQKSIVAYLDKVFAPIDEMIASYESMKDYLLERKQIIINDVVTGKVKVV